MSTYQNALRFDSFLSFICDPQRLELPEVTEGWTVEKYVLMARRRALLARRVMEFSEMNYRGLNSNCASFAHYLTTGQLIPDVTKYRNYFVSPKSMHPYRGQRLEVGDVILSFWLRQNLEEMYKGGSTIWSDTLAASRALLSCTDVLSVIGRKQRFLKDPCDADTLRSFAATDFTRDYHFLVCIGYFKDDNGVTRPVFVQQSGHNRVRPPNLILLPPFGEIRIVFFDQVVNEKDLPYAVFCSAG